ncbi:hypothetical protein AB9P05_05750 [Roseivirga sp. BDSF3-8]|uniref:hypothetical protein n=1 Tax=Roseivirga sp. BDSF3-8 TaxID=3241598 RepID=UPI003531F293
MQRLILNTSLLLFIVLASACNNDDDVPEGTTGFGKVEVDGVEYQFTEGLIYDLGTGFIPEGEANHYLYEILIANGDFYFDAQEGYFDLENFNHLLYISAFSYDKNEFVVGEFNDNPRYSPGYQNNMFELAALVVDINENGLWDEGDSVASAIEGTILIEGERPEYKLTFDLDFDKGSIMTGTVEGDFFFADLNGNTIKDDEGQRSERMNKLLKRRLTE